MALYLGDTKVSPVVGVPVPETKYGATLDTVLGSTLVGDLSFDGVTSVGSYEFAYKFAKPRNLFADKDITIQFPDLVEIKGYGCYGMFFCGSSPILKTNTRVSFLFPKLTSIKPSGLNLFAAAVGGGSGSRIVRLEFPLLNTAEGYSFSEAFRAKLRSDCYLESVIFPSLTTLKGSGVFQQCFTNQTALKIASFPALTTIEYDDAFSQCFDGCTALTEIHFPAAMQARVEQLYDYADKWGATNATIYFDL